MPNRFISCVKIPIYRDSHKTGRPQTHTTEWDDGWEERVAWEGVCVKGKRCAYVRVYLVCLGGKCVNAGGGKGSWYREYDSTELPVPTCTLRTYGKYRTGRYR